MSGHDFFLNKKIIVRKVDNWKIYGILESFDNDFLFIKMKDDTVKAISKKVIAD
jgi:small nuclear ribonucleoprotein (snRNP)-like protein